MSEPKLSKNTRKLNGSILVNCYVEPDGTTSNVHATRTTVKEVHLPVDETELEESAVRAVQRYKFKPSSKNGQPVRVQLNVEVNFASR
jgi:protein TonB